MSDLVAHCARIQLAAMRGEAIRVHYRASDRLARLRAQGAPVPTIREECYRVTRGDRRRATVRPDGTIPLPGDTDYKGRRFAVCLFPMPVAPHALRIAGKVSAPGVDSARAEVKVTRAVDACDSKAHALHAARASVTREIGALVRAHSRSTGAKRKALTFKIRAMLRAYSSDSAIMDAARAEGWHI